MTQPRTNSPRTTSPINARLNRQLMAYAAAASAAGVGMLTAPQVAEAKIVYTPTNVSMTGAGLPIDLDNDGVPDFEVVEFICGDREGCVFVNPMVAGNGIKALSSAAQAGVYGLPVGAQGQFLTQFVRVTSTESAVGFMAEGGGYGGTFFSAGPWAHSTNKYLGFKFLIDGKIHYGWARLSVKMFKSSIVLTGYAYETIPNHRILEGHTQGLSANGLPPTDLLIPAPQPASLGMLACGADGLAVWRREDEVAGIDSAKQL